LGSWAGRPTSRSNWGRTPIERPTYTLLRLRCSHARTTSVASNRCLAREST
jgi:hypothetical protein